MHELGIIVHVAKTLKHVALQENVSKIGSVTLEIGEVSGIVESYLTDCWEYYRKKDELIEDYLRLSKVKPKKWWKLRIENEKENKHLLIDTYHLNKEDVFRYGIVEKLKEEYILVLYKNYQVTVEKYHI